MLHNFRYRVLSLCLLLPLLAACATAGFQNLETPHVTLSNVEPAGNMGVFEQRYDVTLRIQNPNNVDLPINGLNYTVILNDREFARGVSRTNVTIPALGDEIIHVTVTNTPFDWVRQIDRLNNDPFVRPSYTVKGTLFLEGFGNRKLPFSETGTFAGL